MYDGRGDQDLAHLDTARRFSEVSLKFSQSESTETYDPTTNLKFTNLVPVVSNNDKSAIPAMSATSQSVTQNFQLTENYDNDIEQNFSPRLPAH